MGSRNLRQRLWQGIVATGVVVGLIVGVPPIISTHSCLTTLKDCSRSLIGPPQQDIELDAVNRVQAASGENSSVLVSELRPVFGRPKLLVSAVTDSEKVALGTFDFSKAEIEEAAHFPDQGKYILIVPAKGEFKSSRYFDFHLFDLDETFAYAFVRMDCNSGYGSKTPPNVMIKNYRWVDAKDSSGAADREFRFDLISSCESVSFNGPNYVDFGKDYSLSGRVEIKFSDDFVPISYGSTQSKEYDAAIVAQNEKAKEIEEACFEKATAEAGYVGWITICRASYQEHRSRYERLFFRDYYSVVAQGKDGEKVRQRWICAGVNSGEYRVVSPTFAYVVCNAATEVYDEELRARKSIGRTNQLALFGFDETPMTLDVFAADSDLRVEGVERVAPNQYAFDLYTNAGEVTVGARPYRIPELPKPSSPVSGALYRGNFIATVSNTGAVLSFKSRPQ